MTRVHDAHPDKHMYWTEGGPDIKDPNYQTDWSKWGADFAAILQNWGRCIIGWNIALDEAGKPNIGPYPCGGIVIINAHTQEVIRSGQYWALSHFSRFMKRGARRVESQSDAVAIGHVAVENPGGQKVLVLTNTGSARAVGIYQGLKSAVIPMKENSIATLVWN